MLNINDIGNGTLSNAIGTEADAVADVMGQIADPSLHKVMGRAVVRTIGETNATSDIVQNALVSMIEHAETFDWTKGSIVSWGCRIAANLARNWRKASSNRNHDSATVATDDTESMDLVDTLVAEDGRATVARQIERKALAAAMLTLDADSQTFLDAMAGGMGQCEAGALVGWSPATTTRRYKAITATLADKL
jgi:RNA polymerase sigma factor (sigma-70 family)